MKGWMDRLERLNRWWHAPEYEVAEQVRDLDRFEYAEMQRLLDDHNALAYALQMRKVGVDSRERVLDAVLAYGHAQVKYRRRGILRMWAGPLRWYLSICITFCVPFFALWFALETDLVIFQSIERLSHFLF